MELKLHDLPDEVVYRLRDGEGNTHKQTYEDRRRGS